MAINDSSINERIKALMQGSDYKNISSFAKANNIPQTTLNDCVSKGKEPRHTLILKIANASPLINLEWIITGKGHMFKEYNSNSSSDIVYENPTEDKKSEKKENNIPYFSDLPVSVGEGGLAELGTAESPSEYMSIPNVPAKYLFPVLGYSMLPKIKPGDVIGVNPVHNWDRVEPDKVYMIVTTEEKIGVMIIKY